MERYKEIYPQLPSDNKISSDTGDTFRLEQSQRWLSELEKDLQDREKTYKKYKRSSSALLNL